MSRRSRLGLAIACLVAGGLAAGAAGAAAKLDATSCTTCHADADLFEAEHLEILDNYRVDIHAEIGLSCHDCHGGNPDPTLADDMFAAKDETYEPNPYRGMPARSDVPGFCGACHSDPSYMRRFRPDARVDQEREYWTSHHGIALAAGDENVATCVDCHGNHGIRRADDPESSVYPTRVGETCGDCHSDRQRMAGYVTDSGRPLSIDQLALWRRSVHARAMFERADLSAPTCNDCHGNHGAAPPGLASVTFVCGQCHGREAELFRASGKHEGYQEHHEFLADAGEEGCALCHEGPQQEAGLKGVTDLGECTSCHANHGTIRPTVAMFGVLPAFPCSFCHESPGLIDSELEEPEAAARNFADTLQTLLVEGAEEGLTEEALFNWLVDRALELPAHTVSGEVDSQGRPLTRPEFRRLFDKFRIGKTYFTYTDPETGEEARAEIIRCTTCHASGADIDDTTPGAATGVELVNRMAELTVLTAQAERTLLRVHRGGVEIRDAMLEVDQAVDAQIGLEVQVHSFSAAEGSEFMATFETGMGHARAALAGGMEGRRELQSRRYWLLMALAAVAVTLVGLALKIRQVSSGESAAAEASGS